jgi:hypothetical protein
VSTFPELVCVLLLATVSWLWLPSIDVNVPLYDSEYDMAKGVSRRPPYAPPPLVFVLLVSVAAPPTLLFAPYLYASPLYWSRVLIGPASGPSDLVSNTSNDER